MQAKSDSFLKYLRFRSFDLWDTKRYTRKSISSKYEIIELGKCIKEENKKYKLFEEEETEFGILGVNNKIGIFDAYKQKGKEINQSYKRMEKGWLAYNPYRINVGSIGVKRDDHKYEYISPAYVVFSCKNNILPEYLFITFKTMTFNKSINESTTGSVRQNLTIDILKKLEIPLPSLIEQEKLVIDYYQKLNQAHALEKEAIDLEGEIERYLFEELGIVKSVTRVSSAKLKFTTLLMLERWGVDNNLGKGNDILKSNKFNNLRLGSIVEINPTTKLPLENVEISFIPMECVSDKDGEVKELRKKHVQDSKGYTKFKEGDLIWARITPCMENGKSAIVNGLTNNLGCGSTEFHVIRNHNPNINLKYLHTILRTDIVLKNAKTTFTGSAGQQRVPKSYLENLSIPIPNIEIQDRIENKITSMKNDIKMLRLKSEQLKIEAEQEFETAIFK